jgi:signal transduction histidine kinase
VQAHAATLREQSLIEERTRIARELHDVVAHHISSIAIQAESARFTTPGLSELGAERFAAIGDSARAALDEMRRLLGVMRAPLAAAELAPQPGLDQIDHLVEETRALGTDVRFTVCGNVTALSEDVELVAYRIAQEALTNARRHAPRAAVDVTLEYRADALTLAIRDHGPGAGDAVDSGGFGVLGMRERAAAVGGTLTHRDHPDGGFEVVASIPVKAPT